LDNKELNKTIKINSKLRLKKIHETPDRRLDMLSKEEIKEDFIKKHKSQVDFYLPDFKTSFLSSCYLNNINDYSIKEANSPREHKTIKLKISPHKLNQSYFDSLTGIEKHYNESTTSLNSSWSDYHER